MNTNCQHNSRIGDNYGASCSDCGKQLEGFGYGGWFGRNLSGKESCIHHYYVQIGENGKIETCIYCENVKAEE